MCLQKAMMEYFYSMSISVIFMKLHDVTQMADNFYSIFLQLWILNVLTLYIQYNT